MMHDLYCDVHVLLDALWMSVKAGAEVLIAIAISSYHF
jgi:hypothetical protein